MKIIKVNYIFIFKIKNNINHNIHYQHILQINKKCIK